MRGSDSWIREDQRYRAHAQSGHEIWRTQQNTVSEECMRYRLFAAEVDARKCPPKGGAKRRQPQLFVSVLCF